MTRLILILAALILAGCTERQHDFQYRDPGAMSATGHSTWEAGGGRPQEGNDQ